MTNTGVFSQCSRPSSSSLLSSSFVVIVFVDVVVVDHLGDHASNSRKSSRRFGYGPSQCLRANADPRGEEHESFGSPALGQLGRQWEHGPRLACEATWRGDDFQHKPLRRKVVRK